MLDDVDGRLTESKSPIRLTPQAFRTGSLLSHSGPGIYQVELPVKSGSLYVDECELFERGLVPQEDKK